MKLIKDIRKPKEKKKSRRQYQEKLVHPNSRKASKLGAKVLRKHRIERVHEETNLKRGALIEKLLWFQEQLDSDKTFYSRKELCEIIEKYLRRFDEELEQIDIIKSLKHRKGRQHASREDVILATLAREKEAYTTSGLEVPDVLSVHGCEIFRAWNGEARYLQTLKLTKITAMEKEGENKTTNLVDREDAELKDITDDASDLINNQTEKTCIK
ncbi:translation machinery-associated protein 16-like [Anneissia japonica]|uniref:translation machinery-associated protein 16-like n=1 Tax=Anneissia japonica TaxID=1529436 RepID=UPI00142552CE|nr:translation machinery-associated protein 16-like [Anneissia japonica]